MCLECYVAEIKTTASHKSSLASDPRTRTFWRCSACGEAITPGSPGLAKWETGQAAGPFSVVHEEKPCDDGAGRSEDLSSFMSSLLQNSLGLDAAAELTSHPSFSAGDFNISASGFETHYFGTELIELLSLNSYEAALVGAYAKFRILAGDLNDWMTSPAHRDAVEVLYWMYDALRTISIIAPDPHRKTRIRNDRMLASVSILSHYLRPPSMANNRDFYLSALDTLPEGEKIRAAIDKHQKKLGSKFNR